MPSLTREQAQKWTKDLPQGWKFDAQHYVMWGEKEIFTDSAENEKGVFYRLTLEYRAETVNAGYFRKETGKQIPTVSVSRYTPTGSGMYSVVHILTENAAEPETKKKYNVLLNLAGKIDTAEYFRRAAEKDTGKAYNDFSDFSGVIEDVTENAAEPAQEVTESAEATAPAEDMPEMESTTEAEESADNGAAFNIPTIPEKCRKAYFDGEMTLEQIAAELYSAGMIAYIDANAAADYLELEREEEPAEAVTIVEPESACVFDENGEEVQPEELTEGAPTMEPEPAPEESKEEPAAPDMFATLAAAYFSGKTVKAKPRPVEPKAEEPPQEEEPAPEPEPEPAPPVPGWHENSNDTWKLTAEERKALSAGVPVVRKERYNNGTYFSVPYSARVRMVYKVHSYDERDNIAPGLDASFCGFMIDGNIYLKDVRRIGEKLAADIEQYLKEHIKSESDAAHCSADVMHSDEYKRGRIEELKERDFYDDAKRLFFDRKRPELTLYIREYPRETHGYDTIINYLLDPEKTIEVEALRYMCDFPEKIYSAWIRFNRLSATFEKINSDSGNDEHKLRRISESIKDQKTVRLLLTNNATVKCEADAVKRLPFCGYISQYDVSASDRKLLPQEGRYAKEIRAADIVEISHGGRVLYSA